MIKMNELAVTDLNYRVAQPNPDGTITHYVMPLDVAEMVSKKTPKELMKQRLKDKLGIEAEIVSKSVEAPNVMQVEDVTSELTKDARLLMTKANFKQTILQYNMERPVEKGLFAKTARFLKKLSLKLGIARGLRRLELIEEIYRRRMSQAIYLGVRCREDQLGLGYLHLSSSIETLGESVRGSLAGAMRIELADLIGDGHTRYMLVAYVHVDQALSHVFHSSMQDEDFRKKFRLIQEGGLAEELIQEETPEIKIVKL